MDKIINKKEIRVLGIKRSGQHAIMQWIVNNCKGKVVAINTARLDQNIYKKLRDSHLIKNNYLYKLNLESERNGNFEQKDCLVYNEESKDLSKLKRYLNDQKRHDIFVGKSKSIHNILILRDPYNLFASHFFRYRKRPRAKKVEKYFNDLAIIWKQYAKEYLGETNHLDNKILINYNKWFLSEEERLNVLESINLPAIDNSINFISKIGGGVVLSIQENLMEWLKKWKCWIDGRGLLKMNYF